jgi:hypothetical protein
VFKLRHHRANCFDHAANRALKFTGEPFEMRLAARCLFCASPRLPDLVAPLARSMLAESFYRLRDRTAHAHAARRRGGGASRCREPDQWRLRGKASFSSLLLGGGGELQRLHAGSPRFQ